MPFAFTGTWIVAVPRMEALAENVRPSPVCTVTVALFGQWLSVTTASCPTVTFTWA